MCQERGCCCASICLYELQASSFQAADPTGKNGILLVTGQQQVGYIEGATAPSSMVISVLGTAYLCLSFFEGSSSETVKDRSMLKCPFHMVLWFHMCHVDGTGGRVLCSALNFFNTDVY